jgi:hypothetical protein
MTESDVSWLHMLFAKRYASQYDATTSENWFKNYVLKSPILFYPARTQNAFCISLLSLVPWAPNQIECNVVAVCADDGAMWETARLLRASIDWARRRKALTWRICSETDHNLAALAKRVGATEVWPRFVLRL